MVFLGEFPFYQLHYAHKVRWCFSRYSVPRCDVSDLERVVSSMRIPPGGLAILGEKRNNGNEGQAKVCVRFCLTLLKIVKYSLILCPQRFIHPIHSGVRLDLTSIIIRSCVASQTKTCRPLRSGYWKDAALRLLRQYCSAFVFEAKALFTPGINMRPG